MTRDHDDRNIRIGLHCFLQKFNAIYLRHFDITQNNIIGFFLKFFQSFFAICGFIYFISFKRKNF